MTEVQEKKNYSEPAPQFTRAPVWKSIAIAVLAVFILVSLFYPLYKRRQNIQAARQHINTAHFCVRAAQDLREIYPDYPDKPFRSDDDYPISNMLLEQITLAKAEIIIAEELIADNEGEITGLLEERRAAVDQEQKKIEAMIRNIPNINYNLRELADSMDKMAKIAAAENYSELGRDLKVIDRWIISLVNTLKADHGVNHVYVKRILAAEYLALKNLAHKNQINVERYECYKFFERNL